VLVDIAVVLQDPEVHAVHEVSRGGEALVHYRSEHLLLAYAVGWVVHAQLAKAAPGASLELRVTVSLDLVGFLKFLQPPFVVDKQSQVVDGGLGQGTHCLEFLEGVERIQLVKVLLFLEVVAFNQRHAPI